MYSLWSNSVKTPFSISLEQDLRPLIGNLFMKGSNLIQDKMEQITNKLLYTKYCPLSIPLFIERTRPQIL